VYACGICETKYSNKQEKTYSGESSLSDDIRELFEPPTPPKKWKVFRLDSEKKTSEDENFSQVAAKKLITRRFAF